MWKVSKWRNAARLRLIRLLSGTSPERGHRRLVLGLGLSRQGSEPVSNRDHLLKIRLEGANVGSGRIPVDHLIHLLSEFRKVLLRTGAVLQGDSNSVRRGSKPKSLTEGLKLDLVNITEGSPVTVLEFDRTTDQPGLPGIDLGMQTLEKAVQGLSQVQQDIRALPPGFDRGVLLAWRDLGLLFEKGVSRIEFGLNDRPQPVRADYTRAGYRRVQELIQGPRLNMRAIEGRLLMADFKEHGTRCRVHPAVGDPVLCLFDEEQKEEVLDSILHFVRVIGEAREEPESGRIASIKIADIQVLEDRENDQEDLLPVGIPLPMDFWRSLTIEELARSQNVEPLRDPTILFGTWPGEVDDGFEEAIRTLRQRDVVDGTPKDPC